MNSAIRLAFGLVAGAVWLGASEKSGPQMPTYRADVINVDGSILDAINLVCPSDDVAKENAQSLVAGHDVALWRGSRMVAKFRYKLFRPRIS
jgi:hypothetical protein